MRIVILGRHLGGGLSNSSAEDPYLFPSSSGNYVVSLVVTNNMGTDSTGQIIQINVASAPVAVHGVNSTDLEIPNAFAYFSNSSVNATSYLWDFGDGNSSVDYQPWHEYTSNGTYYGYLVAMNSGCENDTSFFTINVGTQGLEEKISDIPSVYPNPFTSTFQISNAQLIEKMEILDVQGRLVAFDSMVAGDNLIVNLNSAASGIYTLIIYTQDKHSIHKLIKG